MAKILDNITKVHTGFPDGPKQSLLKRTLKEHAVPAMMAGIKSPEARKYMSMFADNEEQLKLLTNPENVASMPWLHETQAYLMANAICTPITDGQTGNGIFKKDGQDGLNAFDASIAANPAVSVVGERPEAFTKLFEE